MTQNHRGQRFPVEVLTREEADTLLRVTSKRCPTGIRNRALLAVLYRSGLRIAEALALYPKDVDLEAGTVRVLDGKGHVARTVGLDTGAVVMVEQWLAVRAKKGLNGTGPLFCTLAGKKLWPQYVRALLPRLAKRAGIQKRVHPHGLRHTHAAELAREGLAINLIAAQLGHRSIATTAIYLSHIAPEELVGAIRRREWTPR